MAESGAQRKKVAKKIAKKSRGYREWQSPAMPMARRASKSDDASCNCESHIPATRIDHRFIK
jgi:hypothetical protein